MQTILVLGGSNHFSYYFEGTCKTAQILHVPTSTQMPQVGNSKKEVPIGAEGVISHLYDLQGQHPHIQGVSIDLSLPQLDMRDVATAVLTLMRERGTEWLFLHATGESPEQKLLKRRVKRLSNLHNLKIAVLAKTLLETIGPSLNHLQIAVSGQDQNPLINTYDWIEERRRAAIDRPEFLTPGWKKIKATSSDPARAPKSIKEFQLESFSNELWKGFENEQQAFTTYLWTYAEQFYLATLDTPFIKGISSGRFYATSYKQFLLLDYRFMRFFKDLFPKLAVYYSDETGATSEDLVYRFLYTQAVGTLQSENETLSEGIRSLGLNPDTDEVKHYPLNPELEAYCQALRSWIQPGTFKKGIVAIWYCLNSFSRMGREQFSKDTHHSNYVAWTDYLKDRRLLYLADGMSAVLYRTIPTELRKDLFPIISQTASMELAHFRSLQQEVGAKRSLYS